MPPRKRHYFHGRRRGEPPKDLQGDDLIHQQIHKSKHPFEENGFISAYTMTPSQKAITCAIRLNGGHATEEELLQFLHKHWDYIGKMNTKLPNNIPDARILHINLSVKKKGVSLFIKDKEHPDQWILNTSTKKDIIVQQEEALEEQRSNKTTDHSDFEEMTLQEQTYPFNREYIKRIHQMPSGDFENTILKILENSNEPLTETQIIEQLHGQTDLPGLFAQLPIERRLRAVLVVLKQYTKCKNENGKWVYINETSSPETTAQKSPASEVKPPISSLTIAEFYDLVQKNVFSKK